MDVVFALLVVWLSILYLRERHGREWLEKFILIIIKIFDMKNLKAALGLSENATEAGILKAIEKMKAENVDLSDRISRGGKVVDRKKLNAAVSAAIKAKNKPGFATSDGNVFEQSKQSYAVSHAQQHELVLFRVKYSGGGKFSLVEV